MSAEPRVRKFSWALAFTISVIVGLLFLVLVLYRIESWPMRTARQASGELERVARKARDAFVDLAQMQPRVTIHNRVYLEKTTAVAELALVSRQLEVEHEFEHTWAGSTKRIKLHGTYQAKAGFDLREKVDVNVTEKEIAVQMPRAQILGLEQENLDVLELENGYWNKISPGDLQTEIAALPKLAREKAEQANLAGEAERMLQKQLQERLGPERPLRLQFTAPAISKP